MIIETKYEIFLVTESHNSDVNTGEMLGNECFSDYKDINEERTIATIFQICGVCGKAKDGVKDYGESISKQGYCPDCADKYQ